MVNGRRRWSYIKEIEGKEGNLIRNQEDIGGEITNFYTNMFADDLGGQTMVGGLNRGANSWLERPFEEEEVWRVFSVDYKMSQGPDGFNATFFKESWDIIRKHVWISLNRILSLQGV